METFDAGQSPFRETIDTHKFFPGARRREVLEELKSAITDSVALLTLTGEEGCGKTMLCRMLEKELPDGYVLVIFSQTLDSFEDVTRVIAQEMKITLADDIALGDIRDLLLEVWERLAERKQRMLIVFDQAERIYLATLERIRKMLDIMNQTGIIFQILFSGRHELLDNLKQLSMCSFHGAEERHFVLEPLNSSATYSYLNFRMNDGQAEENEAFSQEASEKIFMMAGGNFRKTNMLAEESLQLSTADTSFTVSLDDVRETKMEEPSSKWNFAFFEEKYLAYKKWLIPVGACLSVLFLLLIIRTGRSPDIHEKKPIPELEKLSAEIRDIQKKAEEIKAQASQTFVGQPPPTEKEQVKGEEILSTQVISSTVEEGVPDKTQTVEKKSEAVVVELQDKAKQSKQETHVPVRPPVEKISVDQLFNARIAVAAKWLVGEKNDHYTIQLMVLASEGAENNLKKMLAQKEYQDVANKLFFLRKAAATPTVLVFYGEYSTMIDARNARNTLPEFLLKHNPYAISVRGAVEKANGG
jgi:type II secretory pathway predicted ATPase ExeA